MRELLNRVWKKEEGFSLIELIIVIAILAIIAAIAVPNLLGNIQNANEATDESNAKLIADAVATAIAQDSTLEGSVITDVAFTSAGIATLGATTDERKVMEDAVLIMNNAIPQIKSNEYKDTATGLDFEVTLTTAGQVTITNDNNSQTIFPTPQN